MKIIIEGIDGSGKTTLAHTLAQSCNTKYIHHSNPKSPSEFNDMLKMYKQECSGKSSIIFDRAWYSEMAYGPVMRNTSAISWPDMYSLETDIAKTGGLIIYCTGDPHIMFEAAHMRGEDYMKEYQLFLRVHQNFEKIMHAPHWIPVVTYKCPKYLF